MSYKRIEEDLDLSQRKSYQFCSVFRNIFILYNNQQYRKRVYIRFFQTIFHSGYGKTLYEVTHHKHWDFAAFKSPPMSRTFYWFRGKWVRCLTPRKPWIGLKQWHNSVGITTAEKIKSFGTLVSTWVDEAEHVEGADDNISDGGRSTHCWHSSASTWTGSRWSCHRTPLHERLG